MSSDQQLYIGELRECLLAAVGKYDRVFVLTDTNTQRLCLPCVDEVLRSVGYTSIVVPADDTNKNVESLCRVWEALSTGGASRKSLLVNLGGGMITDLGGFAAATFKRGIGFINIPTTVLGMVDAAVGGKTGINFAGLKNEVGAFCTDWQVIIHAPLLASLDSDNLLSGYAEMLKHGLISNAAHLNTLLDYTPNTTAAALQQIEGLIAESVRVKQRIVEEDPFEHGIRKALNLGHTVGHAFESLSFERSQPLLHGYAVAYGLICELYLSCLLAGFPEQRLQQVVRYIREHYNRYEITCDDYDRLYELMTHDKKNSNGVINFTLLSNVGDIKINQTATKSDIFNALDFYREG